MKRLLLILSIATGLTITGCGSDDSGHSHGEDADHSHGQEAEQHVPHNEEEHGHPHEGEEEHGHPHDSSDTTDETHAHSGEDAHAHEGEDTDKMLALDQTYEQVRKGVRLTLSYDSETSSFTGTMENTTQEALPQVTTVVQLSNGTELGPTSPVDLRSGERHSVELDAAGESFDGWSAHSEIGSSGHSHGEDGDHEHHN